MGRPEPCILFAQTFSHSQLDEYVDEVLFAEPIVVTACEFLEQNASLSTPMLTVQGATAPPSFAMEVFVHCEGESRFRRLCQPFLYSHSSSNVLEVEAVITNHLVVRGCYRSLTLVVHGNTAEDFGQFNIEFDLDNSVASLVSSPSEGKLEDLPPALLLDRSTFEESISSTKSLVLPVPVSYLSSEMKQFLKLTLNIYQISDDEDTICKVARSVVAVVCSHVATDYQCGAFPGDGSKLSNKAESKEDTRRVHAVLSEEKIELFELFKRLQTSPSNDYSLEEEVNLEADADMANSQLLVDTLHQCFPFLINATPSELPVPFQKKNLILCLNVVLLLCSARDGCFHFVKSGGMEQIAALVAELFHRSTSLALLILGVIENATRHAIGCEGFLGWWPRENESVPVGKSDGYSNLLKMLLTKQRHDVASLATYVLQRLHFYESVSRYESAILSVLAKLPTDEQHLTDEVDSLSIAASQLEQIMKLLNLCGRIEDPSPAAAARRSIIPGRSEGLLSYTGTSSYISLSKYTFSKWDIDTCMLLLLKEKGFLPLSAALLSSSLLHSSSGSSTDIFVDIATSIQSLLLSLLFCRSGLTLLLLQPEATATIILSLQGVEERSREECSTLRQAAVLMSKNFFCHPQEVAVILETHLRVGNAVDRLLTTPINSDELLWVLWDLCSISRSDCGRQALLSLGFFPEAVSVLLGALHSLKDSEQIAINNGTSPLCLATFHSAAEIFEVMVTDSTASSLNSWIGHAVELHKALHSSSPGSNRKDAPTRLLEWVDAGVVYHKNGAIGLLKYAAILASGGDAHLSSASVLVSDSMDVENVVGDSNNSSDAQILDILLGKFVSDKYFDGVILRSSSIVQLTSAIRILSFISENSAVAAALFEEGAVTLIYVVLSNCKCMLEQSSNTYDYLVDEGAECNSTSDLLLERSHEQNLVDLIIPSLVLLINLLQRLHEAKEPYRNKKLVNILLRLHREVSPKLAARATDYSSSYPSLLLGFGAVCHLIASTLACWPIFNWIPSLFHCLLESQATSSLALGPKDACSMLHLLGDFFPEEGIWLWCNGMPPLSAFRTLSIGSILGPESERDVDWFLQPEHLTVLLVRLTPQLDRIAQIVLHFAFSTLVIIQDMLRVFIIRIACQRTECAVVLLRPLISWIDNHVNEASHSEIDNFKVHRLLDFIASLLEHPRAKTILLKVEAVEVLHKILRRFADAYNLDGKLNHENIVPGGSITSRLSWSIPLFKSLALIFEPQASVEYSKLYDKYSTESISIEVSTLIGCQLLRLCQVLPVGGELLACFLTLKEFALSNEGRNALLEIFSEFKVSVCKEQGVDERDLDADVSVKYNWRCSPPFFHCWKKLLTSLDSKDDTSIYNFEIIYALSLSALCLCMGSENLEGLSVLKWLFGLPYDLEGDCPSPDERMNDVLELVERLDQRPTEDDIVPSNKKITFHQVKESVRLMLELLQSSVSSSRSEEALVSSEGSSIEVIRKLTTSQLIPTLTMSPNDDESVFSHIWKPIENAESDNNIFSYGGLAEKFVWECPDTSSDRLMQAPQGKRKMTSMEIPGKRVRENSGSESVNVFSRTPSIPVVSSGPSRRDTFRQRKPNTSRPPSMHVDDYVARERNIDGASSGSHVLTSQRGGSTSGRPPSVHVDEFEARQRERQNPTFVTVGSTTQAKPLAHDDLNVPGKLDKSHQLKADIDDELQEIDIVFDEESGSDDRLPFPQPDDNLQSDPVIARGRSPGSVVEETEGDANEGAQASEDVNSRPETALKILGSQPEIPKEGTFSFDKSLPETNAGKAFFRRQSDEPNYASPTSSSKGSDALPPGFPSHMIHPSATQSLQALAPPNFHQRGSPQQGPNNSGSQGYYEHKFPISQPPLPPMPPPNVSAMSPQTTEVMPGLSSPYIHREMQPPFLSGYALQAFNSSGTAGPQSENFSSMNNGSLMSRTNAQPVVDNKYLRNTDSPGGRLHGEKYSSSTASQPLPPLPPMPPPFSTPMAQSVSSSGSQSLLHTQNLSAGSHLPSHSAPISDAPLSLFSGNSLSSFSLSPFTQPLLMSRPPAVTGTFFGSPTQQLGQISSSGPQSMPSPQPPMQSVQPQLPPLPQHPHPPHLAQNLGISVHVPQPQFEQMIPIQQGSIQVQMQPLQMRQQQIHIPQIQLLYQPQQQEQFQQPPQPLLEHTKPKLEADNTAQQQNDLGALQQYFSSPEAIQSLLSDRDKLCQLLEQNPKIMEMLQAKLGQM